MAINEQLTRLGRGLKNLLLLRRMPGGLASWRLLLPTADPCIRAHRAMWRHALHPRLPLPAAIAVEVFVWLRWVLCYAWIDSWRCWHQCRRYRLAPKDPGSWQDGVAFLRLALLHGIHPWDSYCFGIYRPERRHLLWQYVYEHESYHAWRSAGRTDWRAACELLADKLAWTTFMQEKQLPVVPILAVLPAGNPPDFNRWLQEYPALFCKTQRGSRGEGAFTVERQTNGTHRLCRHRDTAGNVDAEVAQWIASSDYLVQPRQQNHPALATVSRIGDLVELRVITEHQQGSASLHSAFLQVAVPDRLSERYWLSFPVDLAAGTICRPPAGTASPTAFQSEIDNILVALGTEPLPGWPGICSAVLQAHSGVLAGACGIAWDVLITPDGPRILEGNSGWGMTAPQMLSGPFLAGG